MQYKLRTDEANKAQIVKFEERDEKEDYKFSNNALVNKNWNGDAEYSNESKVAASPAEI